MNDVIWISAPEKLWGVGQREYRIFPAIAVVAQLQNSPKVYGRLHETHHVERLLVCHDNLSRRRYTTHATGNDWSFWLVAALFSCLRSTESV